MRLRSRRRLRNLFSSHFLPNLAPNWYNPTYRPTWKQPRWDVNTIGEFAFQLATTDRRDPKVENFFKSLALTPLPARLRSLFDKECWKAGLPEGQNGFPHWMLRCERRWPKFDHLGFSIFSTWCWRFGVYFWNWKLELVGQGIVNYFVPNINCIVIQQRCKWHKCQFQLV